MGEETRTQKLQDAWAFTPTDFRSFRSFRQIGFSDKERNTAI